MRYLIFLFLFAISCSSIAQNIGNNYSVTFIEKNGKHKDRAVNRWAITPRKISQSDFLRNIPLEHAKYAIFSVTINDAQVVYNKYIDGEFSYERYQRFVQLYSIDTLSISKDFVKINQFYIYVGLNKEKREKYIIIDVNNNLDFSDDKQYVFSLAEYDQDYDLDEMLKLCPAFDIEVSPEDKTKQSPIRINLLLHPFLADNHKNEYPTEDDYYLEISLLTNFYRQASFEINGKHFISNATNTKFYNILPFNVDNNSAFVFYQEEDKAIPSRHQISDTIILAGEKLRLEKAIDNTLYLTSMGAAVDSSKIGNFIPALFSNSLYEDKMIHLNDLAKDKYALIDFWGSWCAPCIASIPKMIELHDVIKNRDDAIILGIALEHKADVEKVKKIIKDKNIEWPNFWNVYANKHTSASIHGKLNIERYPTYIVVDKSGRIVYRSSDINLVFSIFLDIIKNER